MDGKAFHDLSMRTAAGPENWFVTGQRAEQLAKDLLTYIHAARQLDRWKSEIIYGKTKDESKFDKLPDHLHSADWKNLSPELTHAILGCASEGGELAEHLFSMLLTGLVDTRGLVEETGDTDWFQELLARSIGIPVDEARAQVIDKLRKRYQDRYSQDEAVDRADKAA